MVKWCHVSLMIIMSRCGWFTIKCPIWLLGLGQPEHLPIFLDFVCRLAWLDFILLQYPSIFSNMLLTYFERQGRGCITMESPSLSSEDISSLAMIFSHFSRWASLILPFPSTAASLSLRFYKRHDHYNLRLTKYLLYVAAYK